MSPVTILASQDEHEALDLLHVSGCYDSNKARLYRAALREGLKVLLVKHDLSVMAKRLPLNELIAEAFAQPEASEVQP